MGFSVILFGTPLGYQYEKIDNSTGAIVCPDSMANKFDSFDVHKLGLRPSEQIWVMFKQIAEDGQSVIGFGLYQSAYEYNQDRSGGYYGVGLLLQDVNCSDFEELKSITERIFSSTSKVMLKNNKHTEEHYQKLKNQLIASSQFDNLMEKINSLLINPTAFNEDLAKLTPSYLYTFNKNISKVFDLLMKNKNHFDSFVCFGIDTPETKQSIEQLGNKKLYSTKDLIAQLDAEIKNGAINTKENRLRSSYQAVLNAKKQNEKNLDELSTLLQTNTQKIDQLELSRQSLITETHSIEQNKKANEVQLEENKKELDILKLEMKKFEQETGRELLVAKTKPTPPLPEVFPDSFLPSSSNAAIFDVFGSRNEVSMNNTRVTSDNHQQGQTPNRSRQQPRQSRSHRSDEPSSIVSIVAWVIIFVLIGILAVIIYKHFFPEITHNSQSIPNATQSKDIKNDFDNQATPHEKQEED